MLLWNIVSRHKHTLKLRFSAPITHEAVHKWGNECRLMQGLNFSNKIDTGIFSENLIEIREDLCMFLRTSRIYPMYI
jgi:hypothetical protein